VPGKRIQIESAGHTHIVTVRRAFSETHLLISMISALFFWAVAFFVFAERPERDPGRVFFLSTFCYGLAIAMGTIAFPTTLRSVDLLRPVVRLLCLALIPALFVQLSLTFPRRRPVMDSRPWGLPTLFLVAFTLAAWRSTVLVRYFLLPTGAHWHASVLSE